MEGRILNRVDRNVGRNGVYYEGVGIWETTYNGNPVYIYRKHLNDIRFARLIFAVNVEAEKQLQDAIKVIKEIIEDNIV